MSKKITIRLGSRLITRRWLWFARTGWVIYGYELWKPGHEHIVYARDHNNIKYILQEWKKYFLKYRDFKVHPELPSEIDYLPEVSDGNFIMADEWNAVRSVLLKIDEELAGINVISTDPYALDYHRIMPYIDEAFPGGYVSTWRWNMRRMAILDLARVKIPPVPPDVRVYVTPTSGSPYWIKVLPVQDPKDNIKVDWWPNATVSIDGTTVTSDQFYYGWDHAYWIEDTIPVSSSDQDFEDIVIRYKDLDDLFKINVLSGEHKYSFDVYSGSTLVCHVPSRSATKYALGTIGTWTIRKKDNAIVTT